MKQLFQVLRPAAAAGLLALGLGACAQTVRSAGPAVRLTAPITNASRTVLEGSHSPRAALSIDMGTLPANTAVKGITIAFNRSAAQQADLDALLAAQANPSSPQYHQWLTPDQFGARFGVADADIQAVESWLSSQGFSVEGVARSHDRVSFSGSAGQVAAAFGTELHRYQSGTETHFAPSGDLQLPTALAPLVSAVLHVSDFRPKPQVRLTTRQSAVPAFTSSHSSGRHFLTPKDVATMYDVNAEYNAGFTGSGQAIAIVGQSYVLASDITNFQTAAGLPSNPPTLVLVPGTGVAGISSGDEGESDLDLEYSGGMAPAANVYLVYVGTNQNSSVFDALTYAINEDIAPVVSISYGECELLGTAATFNSYNALFQQAASQGQTLIASSGDDGSTSCYGDTDSSGNALPIATQEALAVNFPASSPYFTAVGGTQMISSAVTAGTNQYWASASGADVVSSLLSYVPEIVWNEDSTTNGIGAGGGGVSTYFAKPTYQTGVPGIPVSNNRLVPDVSLMSSVGSPGFLYCTSDLIDLQAEDLTTSCTTGFRDASGNYLAVAGGTSFAAPIFAGMVAVLNQATKSTGQMFNTTLYGLAGNATTYAAAFHDITSGGNSCTIASTTYCSAAGASGYSATTGYDEATGLGSVDLAKLIAAWPVSSTLSATAITMTAASTAPAAGAADTININVASSTASAGTPTGTVKLYAVTTAGAAPANVATVTLTSGAASYAYTLPAVSGTYVVTAIYSGDTTHAPSTGRVAITIAGSTASGGAFTFTVAPATVATSSVGTSAVAVTPTGGYTGSVVWTLSTNNATAVICYQIAALPVSGISSDTLYIGVGTSVCGSVTSSPNMRPVTRTAQVKVAQAPAPQKPSRSREVLPMLAGLAAFGFAARRRNRRLPTLLILGLLTTVSLGVSGCGGSSGNNTVVPPVSTVATYNLTLTGRDSVTSTITSSTTFTLTTH